MYVYLCQCVPLHVVKRNQNPLKKFGQKVCISWDFIETQIWLIQTVMKMAKVEKLSKVNTHCLF